MENSNLKKSSFLSHLLALNEKGNQKGIYKLYMLMILFHIFHNFFYYFYFYQTQNIKLILPNGGNIYVVSIVNTPNWVRSNNLWEKWGKDFVQKYPFSTFKFVSFTPNANFSNRLIVNEKLEKSYRGFFGLFNDAVDDFLHNTQLQWLYRTTEDCLVDINLFGRYLNRLTSSNSPLLPVMKGHAVQFATNLFFIHGGSGWIMSRKAAQIYYDHINELNQKYQLDPRSGDDVLLGWFATKYLNLTFNDIDDPYFLGSPYQDSEVITVYNKNWSRLPNCTKSRIDMMKPIKEIIFWHSGRRDNYPMNIGIDAKKVYPPNIFYDQNSTPRRLCMHRSP